MKVTFCVRTRNWQVPRLRWAGKDVGLALGEGAVDSFLAYREHLKVTCKYQFYLEILNKI